MEKHTTQQHLRQSMMHKDVYRPSSSVGRFARFIFSILLVGQSPINYRAQYDRRTR